MLGGESLVAYQQRGAAQHAEVRICCQVFIICFLRHTDFLLLFYCSLRSDLHSGSVGSSLPRGRQTGTSSCPCVSGGSPVCSRRRCLSSQIGLCVPGEETSVCIDVTWEFNTALNWNFILRLEYIFTSALKLVSCILSSHQVCYSWMGINATLLSPHQTWLFCCETNTTASTCNG